MDEGVVSYQVMGVFGALTLTIALVTGNAPASPRPPSEGFESSWSLVAAKKKVKSKSKAKAKKGKRKEEVQAKQEAPLVVAPPEAAPPALDLPEPRALPTKYKAVALLPLFGIDVEEDTLEDFEDD